MTVDGHDTDPASGGSIVQRWRSRWAAARAERTARAIVDGFVTNPPGDLKALERLVGWLDLDLSGPEVRSGGGVFRPASPFAPGGMTGDVRLGRLRPGIVRMYVSFDYDPYHGAPRAAEALRTNHVSVSLDLDRDVVRNVLVGRYGPPRTLERDGKTVEEFGSWYYLDRWERPTSVAWQLRQPDWALPPVPTGASEAFLGALVGALAGDGDAGSVAADLAHLSAAAGATISGSGGRLAVTARPGLPLPVVASAFGWQEPVAWSTDVHMSSWKVGPKDPANGGPALTRIGRWLVDARLDGVPRDAPKLDVQGNSYVYDLRAHPGLVATLLATEAD